MKSDREKKTLLQPQRVFSLCHFNKLINLIDKVVVFDKQAYISRSSFYSNVIGNSIWTYNL